MSTLKALANSSPGLLQPWVIIVGNTFHATLKGLRRSPRNRKLVATSSLVGSSINEMPFPRVAKSSTLGWNLANAFSVIHFLTGLLQG
jgi:hypothetical protein